MLQLLNLVSQASLHSLLSSSVKDTSYKSEPEVISIDDVEAQGAASSFPCGANAGNSRAGPADLCPSASIGGFPLHPTAGSHLFTKNPGSANDFGRLSTFAC